MSFLRLASLFGLLPTIPAAAFDLTGYWASGNGAVYLVTHNDRNVIATCAAPNRANRRQA